MANRTPPAGRRTSAPQSRPGRGRVVLLVAAAVLVVVGVVLGVLLSGNSSGAPPATTRPPATGPEGIPLEAGPVLAPATSAATGQTVDGIQCNPSEQPAYHIHTRLTVYVDGTLRPIPAGIGIVAPIAEPSPDGSFDTASNCYYWLHVHAQDGVIHIESPSVQSYTLGQFFDEWQQPLSGNQVGPATGTLTVFVDGHRYTGDPRAIPLASHEDIQLDVGTPVPPVQIDWTKSSL